jgi:hypothetical protein
VAEILRRRGYDVVVPALPGRIATPADVVAGFLDAVPDVAGTVLVPHSNAGLYVGTLAAERSVEGIVFVDAGLPSEGPATPTAPPEFREFLRGLADADGLLPPWTGWWPDTRVLFPDDDTRAAVEAEQRRLPLAYFDAEVPSPSGWESRRPAYLAFGQTYAEELDTARRRGWPTAVLAGEHLHVLVDPVSVADSVVRLGARD